MTASPRYLPSGSRVPETVPDGWRLVHNHVRPRQRQGASGFRFWLQVDGDVYPPLVACDCDWGPEHYRVDRGDLDRL